ncbi:hypothetical protein BC629DRAFT_192498 [Irpex lacteus]|nr:hypothetical protein BC629DRAFT_192498 [Irpex lacteus]
MGVHIEQFCFICAFEQMISDRRFSSVAQDQGTRFPLRGRQSRASSFNQRVTPDSDTSVAPSSNSTVDPFWMTTTMTAAGKGNPSSVDLSRDDSMERSLHSSCCSQERSQCYATNRLVALPQPTIPPDISAYGTLKRRKPRCRRAASKRNGRGCVKRKVPVHREDANTAMGSSPFVSSEMTRPCGKKTSTGSTKPSLT